MSWSWRTKPRSILKTIEWFKIFNKLDGENWDKIVGTSSNGFPIHPVRRKYYYNTQIKMDNSPIANLSYEEYASGKLDGRADSESNARNDLATFKFFGFGYINSEGNIKVTKAGKLIASDNFDGDMFLKQLLKISFPAPNTDVGRNIRGNKKVFPFELLIKLINELNYINRFELCYLFLCDDRNDYKTLLASIKEFRNLYNNLNNKNDRAECSRIHDLVKDKYFETTLQTDTLSTYGDALIRSLRYSGLFNISGRGNYTKIRVAEHAKKKFSLLVEKYKFKTRGTDNVDDYMEWFGNVDNVILPWENSSDRKELVLDKLLLLEDILNNNNKVKSDIGINISDLYEKYNRIVDDSELRSFENDLAYTITNINEEMFVKYYSKTKEVREEIISKFEDIANGDEDMAALWLECNTWKSLVAINGNQKVRRNFSIEDDLTPRNFAPGVGNTPDMEMFTDKYILLSEVSLMSGVQQWEHEGSSVVDHVIRFIDEYTDKKVMAIFLSNSINIRTNWQFFILNKNSWLNKQIPIVPITINKYIELLKYIYDKNINIEKFIELLEELHKLAVNEDSYTQWISNYDGIINKWKKKIEC